MIDLRTLRDHWTEDGARAVFANLVGQCVLSLHSTAREVRPDPGDEGVDTFVGDFGGGDLRVYQAKYFCDGVGRSQQAQIRDSWKSCTGSKYLKSIVLWTLCLPVDLNVDEEKWWQQWRKKESAKHNIQIELWTRTRFISFNAKPRLKSVFDLALRRVAQNLTVEDTLRAMHAFRRGNNIVPLPNGTTFEQAIFVKKLQAAGISQHRAARTAFYNFELLRQAIEQGGSPRELSDLVDLQSRIFEIWEETYIEHEPDRLGRPLYTELLRRLEEASQLRLATELPAQLTHKKGGVHHWADLCQAGWTHDFHLLGKDEDR